MTTRHTNDISGLAPPTHTPSTGDLPTAERIHLLLEHPSHFRRYLSRLDPEARAGEPGDGRSCPLARFLNAMSATDAPLEIGAERVFLLGELPADTLPVARLPYWAQNFVKASDVAPTNAENDCRATSGPGGLNGKHRPTASSLNRVLDDVLLETLLYRHFPYRRPQNRP